MRRRMWRRWLILSGTPHPDHHPPNPCSLVRGLCGVIPLPKCNGPLAVVGELSIDLSLCKIVNEPESVSMSLLMGNLLSNREQILLFS